MFSAVEPVDARPNPERGLPTRPGMYLCHNLISLTPQNIMVVGTIVNTMMSRIL